MRVVKYWNSLPASVVIASFVNVFKKRLEKVWTEVFPHLPISLLHPIPPAHHLLIVTQLLVLSMSFLQSRCDLRFTITNHNHLDMGALCTLTYIPLCLPTPSIGNRGANGISQVRTMRVVRR